MASKPLVLSLCMLKLLKSFMALHTTPKHTCNFILHAYVQAGCTIGNKQNFDTHNSLTLPFPEHTDWMSINWQPKSYCWYCGKFKVGIQEAIYTDRFSLAVIHSLNLHMYICKSEIFKNKAKKYKYTRAEAK